MRDRITEATDIVVGMMYIVFTAKKFAALMDDTVAARLLHEKFGVSTPEEIVKDIQEMREYSNKGSAILGGYIREQGRRYGLSES